MLLIANVVYIHICIYMRVFDMSMSSCINLFCLTKNIYQIYIGGNVPGLYNFMDYRKI